MLSAKQLPFEFWAEAMNTACYIHNRVTMRGGTTTTLYELWKGRNPKIIYFHIFGSKCQIFTNKDQVDKKYPIGDEGIFLGYSSSRRAYKVYNSRTGMTMESISVVIDDSITEQSMDVKDNVGTSCVLTDEAQKEEIGEFTST